MTEDVQIAALRVLVAVAELGSLTAAAAWLDMAQPGASRAIAGLERSLGLRLLSRTTHGSRPTPEGLMVVEWAREVLTSLDALRANARTLGRDGVDRFRVAASQTIAEQLLPGWLARVRASQPGVRVVVDVMNSEAVIEAVTLGRAGMGFVEGEAPPASLRSVTVASDELVLVVAPDHPWATRVAPVGNDELVTGGLMTREAGSGTRRVLDAALGQAVIPELQLGSNLAVRAAVLAGSGAAVLSRLAVADALAAGQLIELPIQAGPLRRRLRAVWTGPRRPTGAAAALIEAAYSASVDESSTQARRRTISQAAPSNTNHSGVTARAVNVSDS